MKRSIAIILFLTIGLICFANTSQIIKRIQQVDSSQVYIDDAFWSPRIKNNAGKKIHECIGQIENKKILTYNIYHDEQKTQNGYDRRRRKRHDWPYPFTCSVDG